MFEKVISLFDFVDVDESGMITHEEYASAASLIDKAGIDMASFVGEL